MKKSDREQYKIISVQGKKYEKDEGNTEK